MQRKLFLYISLTSVLFFMGCKPKSLVIENPFGEIQKMKDDITYLASDELEGREIGTAGEALAAEYLVQRMKEIGLKPLGENGFIQQFKIQLKSNPHAEAPAPDDPIIFGRNVIGMIDNGAEHTIFIGAHYDHLGYGGGFGSLHTGDPAIHNGADDNASGVTAMLILAERLSKLSLKNNYAFIGFSGEEMGLWGSNYYVDNPTVDFRSINAMINMDMVGRLSDDKKLAIYGNGTSPVWNKSVANAKADFVYSFNPSGIGPSDHTSFYLRDIPVLHIFTGQHKDYHKPSDDVGLINFEGIQEIVNLIHLICLDIDGQGRIPFKKTKDESTETPDFKVTLGVMPDYMFSGKGMRIDGVREDRPAHRADILAGDVVVQMGDLKIFDMMSYMKALSEFEPGSTINVVVKRGNEELIKKVTFDKKDDK